MRITGGLYKGRTVKCPKGVIRPAMDRMRESLFSILGNLNGYSFLDLFSGSGIVAIEAASRGASHIEAVEMDRGKKKTIIENLSIAEKPPKLWVMSAQQFIKRCPGKFDIIYLDPPFPLGEKQKLLELIDHRKLCEEEGKCIIHHPGEEKWPDRIGDLVFSDLRKYGRSFLRFYKNESSS
jgi:16S rRNA (guanine966-N2)-methyltransferase